MKTKKNLAVIAIVAMTVFTNLSFATDGPRKHDGPKKTDSPKKTDGPKTMFGSTKNDGGHSQS